MRTIEDISRAASKYSTLGIAKESLKSAVKPMRIMMGDDNKFWVVTPADAERMHRLGFEYAVSAF